MRRVLLGQTSLSCLCSCDSTCTVDVQSLGVYFGRSRERASERVFILGAVERKLVNPGADFIFKIATQVQLVNNFASNSRMQ